MRFDTNDYSVPVQYAHRKLIVVATVEEVRLVYEDRLVARHRAVLGAGADLLRADPLPGAVGTQARRVRLRPAPGELAAAGVLCPAPTPAGSGRSAHGTRSYIRVLRLLEKFSLAQLTEAVEYALDIDVIDADSIRTIVEHRADRPVELFPLDGRPHLAHVRVETTDVAAYQALLEEVSP